MDANTPSSEHYRVDANLTVLVTATMHLCWGRLDMPLNFTLLYLYRQSASNYGDNTNASNNLATSLKALSGASLSDIAKAKQVMAAKMMRPNTPDESLYMLKTCIVSAA
jgi:hypothetical protein